MNKDNPVEIANITLINQPSKKRMVRIINEADYQNANTARLGFIFGMMDINLGPAQNAQIFDLIQEAIHRYYKNPQHCEMAFDDMISFLNHRLIQIVAFKNLKEKCDLLVGVLKDKKILFCVNGQIHSFLISQQTTKRIYPEDERTLDVSNKIFPYSLNGEVPRGYTIYFCNTDFNTLLNPYGLGKIIKETNIKDIIANIKNYLLEQDATQYYNVLFIYNSPPAEEGGGSKISIENLLEQERKTSEGLSPSLLNIFQKKLNKKPVVSALLKIILSFLFRAAAFIKKSVIFIAVLFFNLFLIATNIRGQRKERQVVVNNQIGGVWYKIMDFYNSLTALSKLILGGIIILAILLTASLGYGLHQQKISQLKLIYKDKMELVEKLYTEAEADILFQDKNTAIKKLKNALSYLQELPVQIQDAGYKQLFNKVKDNLYKIQNISEILSPVLIADFSADTGISLYPPLYSKDDIVSVLNTNGIANIDIKNQNIQKNSLSINGIDSAIYYYDSGAKIIYIFANNILQAINPQNLASEIKSLPLQKDEIIKALAIYNEKLYTLSNADKTFSVWRRNPALSGFGKPVAWINDNMPEGTSVSSFAIDSSVYVLFSNNQIYKYYRGLKADWSYSTEGIADDTVKYKKIITDENHRYIYLIGQKTISIISKEGEFLAHINLPTLTDIKDVAIDESSKTIYALDGNKIYSFTYGL